jgi:hypothetical protein
VEFGRGERKTEDRRTYLIFYKEISAIFAIKKDTLLRIVASTASQETQAMVVLQKLR